MQVRKYQIFKIEAIVRGYITGSAWKEYQKSGTVHGIKIAPGLKESEAFPDGPIYTPSTKAELGAHDENIHPDQGTPPTPTISIKETRLTSYPGKKAAEIVGAEHAPKIAELALALYKTAHAYAYARGLIIADTKFEFGLDTETNEIVLVDEVLTPDSSRFWPKDRYVVGQAQESFDKQYLRDWLTSQGLKGKEGVKMTEEVALKTAEKYREAWEIITGGGEL